MSAESLKRLAEVGSTQFERQQDVVVDCPSEARVLVAVTGVEFVASHLIENAFKYSLPGTSVRITARTKRREYSF